MDRRNIGKIVKRTGIYLLVAAILCKLYSEAPTFGRQVHFNEWAWKHYPFSRIRYYMSDSLVEKLNTEKPNIEQMAEMLGYEIMGGNRIKLGDKHVTYFLMTPQFYLFGLAMYTLDIDFSEDGSFLSAEVIYND